MASRVGPRSVKDATRFTSTIPHATSKSPGRSATAPKPASRLPGETPEQRVRRLRQAHLAAQQAQISKTDRAIDYSRRFLDAAHRFTVGGVILFTAVAGVVSIYSVWDMLQYNRARRAEWVEAQKKLEADELATARLAYIKGEATEEQILLVEEANRDAEEKGIKLPPLLAPAEHRTHFEEHVKPAFHDEARSDGQQSSGKGILGFLPGWIGGSKDEPTSATASVSATDPSTPSSSGVVETVENKTKNVWKQEKENQKAGGSLDRLGLDAGTQTQGTAKKGWWPW